MTLLVKTYLVNKSIWELLIFLNIVRNNTIWIYLVLQKICFHSHYLNMRKTSDTKFFSSIWKPTIQQHIGVVFNYFLVTSMTSWAQICTDFCYFMWYVKGGYLSLKTKITSMPFCWNDHVRICLEMRRPTFTTTISFNSISESKIII